MGADVRHHWLIEILPAAYLSDRLPKVAESETIAIPRSISDKPTFMDSLELFRNGRKLLLLEPGTHHFDRLTVIESPVSEPINMRAGFWPTASDYAYHSSVLRMYRNEILNRLGVDIKPAEDRIFLARRLERRAYNQHELLNIAENFGFRPVYLEDLSFRQQVELMNGSAYIIGPSGAAFANSLFCQPNTRLLSWLTPHYSQFCSFMNISKVVGAELRYIFAEPNAFHNSTAEGFSADYNIDVSVFETCLHKMLNSKDY